MIIKRFLKEKQGAAFEPPRLLGQSVIRKRHISFSERTMLH